MFVLALHMKTVSLEIYVKQTKPCEKEKRKTCENV